MMWSLIMMVLSPHVQAAEYNPQGNLSKAIAVLEKTTIGREIMAEAREKNLSIIEGTISKTEIIATRVFSGQIEKLEFNVQVLISRDKSPVFQAIDLAHELVHALHPKSNPFDPKLNAVDYIREGIESQGGEAHAILQECRVGRELVGVVEQEPAQLIKARCQYVWKTEKNLDQWKQSFYHLGKHYALFHSKLNSINSDSEKNSAITKIVQMKDPLFTSAAANKPYPLALLDEYVEITQKICNNSQRRKIASVDVPASAQMDERCQSLSSALFSK
jgi:hypothetical protein